MAIQWGTPLMFSFAVMVSAVILSSDTTEVLQALVDVLKASYQVLAMFASVSVAARWVWKQAQTHFDDKWEQHYKQHEETAAKHEQDKHETAVQHDKDKAEIMGAVEKVNAKLDGFMAGVRRPDQ